MGAAQADRRQLVPPAPGATAFKRGRPVTLLHQTGQGKNTVAQIHAGGATPPRRSPSVGETATPVTERSWECLRLTPGRSLLLRLFVSSILRLSEDQVYVLFAWAASMLKFWKNLTGPCGAPTYLPTYLPYLWETKKEITRWVKVGYYTN